MSFEDRNDGKVKRLREMLPNEFEEVYFGWSQFGSTRTSNVMVKWHPLDSMIISYHSDVVEQFAMRSICSRGYNHQTRVLSPEPRPPREQWEVINADAICRQKCETRSANLLKHTSPLVQPEGSATTHQPPNTPSGLTNTEIPPNNAPVRCNNATNDL